MKKPDTILDELHSTRSKINAIVGEMSSAERTAYLNQRGESIAREYGFQILNNPNPLDIIPTPKLKQRL